MPIGYLISVLGPAVVTAAVCLYGLYGSPAWIEGGSGPWSSPTETVRERAPPMFVAHGSDDSFVPVAGAREFVARFRRASAGSPFVYVELPGAQYTFDLYRSFRFRAVVDAVDAFTECIVNVAACTRRG